MKDIMVTLGPSIRDNEIIRKLIFEYGITKFRQNMAYPDSIEVDLAIINKFKSENIILFQDFPGKRNKITFTKKEIHLKSEQEMLLNVTDSNSEFYVSNFEDFFPKINIGDKCLFSDGLISATITSIDTIRKEFTIKTNLVGKPLRNNSNFIIPRFSDYIQTFGKNEEEYLVKAKQNNLLPDWVILSFVSNPNDIIEAKHFLSKIGVKLMSKIETPNGIMNLESIAEISDGILIGRGDLSVNFPSEYFPSIHFDLLKRLQALKKNKVVGIGTQYLYNFSDTNIPLRGELIDIHTTLEYDIDFIMLSKETVNSKYPLESIKLLDKLIKKDRKTALNTNQILLPDSLTNNCNIKHKPFVICIEGINGAGKTTLAKKISNHIDFTYKLNIPVEFTEKNIKKRMIFDANWLSSAFYFLAGTIEVKKEIEKIISEFVVIDRSFWSTIAVNWSDDLNKSKELISLYDKYNKFIIIPDLLVILQPNYDTCKKRISSKEKGSSFFDRDTKENFNSKSEFYRVLSEYSKNSLIIDNSNISVSDTIKIIFNHINKIFGKCVTVC